MPVASARIAGKLSAHFRAGMRPLALGVALLTAGAAPAGYLILKRYDLRRQAGIYARQIADMVRKDAEERGPLFWRYDAPKLLEALRFAQGAEGERDIRSVEIDDLSGNEVVPHDRLWPSRPGPAIGGNAPVVVDGAPIAEVRVWMSAASASREGGVLAVVFGVLGVVLGLAIYVFPLQLFREEDLVRALVGRSLRATEEERVRLSRELHDGIAQAIGAAAIAVARLQAIAEPEAQGAARSAALLLDQALDEVRRVARGLRPPALDDLGLSPALVSFARRLCSEAGLELTLQVEDLPRLSGELELSCYRLAQEALANVVRHAGARHVRIELGRRGQELSLRVRDDGCGFSPAGRLGLGLLGARERIAALRGHLELDSAPGAGTELRASFPLDPPAEVPA